jgi:hypothetical protein
MYGLRIDNGRHEGNRMQDKWRRDSEEPKLTRTLVFGKNGFGDPERLRWRPLEFNLRHEAALWEKLRTLINEARKNVNRRLLLMDLHKKAVKIFCLSECHFVMHTVIFPSVENGGVLRALYGEDTPYSCGSAPQ